MINKFVRWIRHVSFNLYGVPTSRYMLWDGSFVSGMLSGERRTIFPFTVINSCEI